MNAELRHICQTTGAYTILTSLFSYHFLLECTTWVLEMSLCVPFNANDTFGHFYSVKDPQTKV